MIKFIKNDFEFSINQDLKLISFQNNDESKDLEIVIKRIIDTRVSDNAPENGFLFGNIANDLEKLGFEIITLIDDEQEDVVPIYY